MSDKPTSSYIKAEAEARYEESRKHLKRAQLQRDPLSAMAAQTQHSFGRVLDALASICKIQEDQAVQLVDLQARQNGKEDQQP